MKFRVTSGVVEEHCIIYVSESLFNLWIIQSFVLYLHHSNQEAWNALNKINSTGTRIIVLWHKYHRIKFKEITINKKKKM